MSIFASSFNSNQHLNPSNLLLIFFLKKNDGYFENFGRI
jgi:hypothetical protein